MAERDGSAHSRRRHRGRRTGFAALTVGFSVGFCALMGGPITGASMNPARSLGPAAAANLWEDTGSIGWRLQREWFWRPEPINTFDQQARRGLQPPYSEFKARCLMILRRSIRRVSGS
jgi:hypothetical protein